MVVFWGGKDTVPDMDWLLSQLPEDTIVHKEDTYEHLDFLWASSVATSVFPQVIEDIENIKKRPPTKRTVSPKYYSHKN
jgi:lysosomal acid lipase/cholesteryl ester hydrolase